MKFVKNKIINNKGFGIVEIVVVIGILSLIVVSVSKVIDAVNRINSLSQLESQALILAQDSLELVTEIQNEAFSCRCAVDACGGSSCSLSDGQVCERFPGYDSCWTEYPADFYGETNFYVQVTGGVATLRALGADPEEVVVGKNSFLRRVEITNLRRNEAGGELDASGTVDFNSKKIKVVVSYDYKGKSYEVSLETMLTGWKNLWN